MTESFKQAFDILTNHAQTLRDSQEPNIDELLSIVTESVAAYKICKKRIDAVQAALEQALSDPAVSTSGAAQMDAPQGNFEDDDLPPPKAIARPAPPRSIPNPHESDDLMGFDAQDDVPF